MINFDPKKYWDERIESHSNLQAIGNVSYPEPINEYRKKSLFAKIDKIIKQFSLEFPEISVLDAGCGVGTYAQYYAEKGAKVRGIDFSSQAIQEVRNQDISGTYQVSSITDIPFKGESFNLVHCFSVLYHIVNDEKWEKALRELVRVTSPSGFLLLRVEWLSQTKRHSEHVKHRDKSEYLEVFEREGLVLINNLGIKDIPRFPGLARRLPVLYASLGGLGLFKQNKTERLLLLSKKR